ncbi:unnamed protein product [Dracunculus medinensis]|uniref:Activin_recp domain-containing protein n=1 Tax=Dracunculus medinensis TaxID=318479 RepID=A0A0N4UIT5_DRAME|nr:unnamed protein product [Dracunculus medinensis]
MIYLLLICWLVVKLSSKLQFSDGSIKCFCDKTNCEDSLICTGDICLIGFRNEGSDSRIDQLCGTDDAKELQKCEQNWKGWQEICACSENFCNTFTYLRSAIDQQNARKDHSLQKTSFEVDAGRNPVSIYPQVYHSNNLIILLVIIPLSVGSLAVCLIFINYHCKMC